MTPTLRPYQVDLYERVRRARAGGKRVIVVQGSTGCGKNTWAAHVVRQAFDRAKNALCIVHRRRLVQQIGERLDQFRVPYGVVMRGEPVNAHRQVQVASRDTLLSRCVRHEWIGMPPADLVIVDEAHHAANPEGEYRRILAAYPGATVLLLSATPVGPDGQGLGPWAEAIECAAPTSQLVRDGYLVPVRCYAPDRQKKGRPFLRGLAGQLVASWQEYAGDRPTVLFCGRVQHSLDAVEQFRRAGVRASHVDANTPDEERDEIFDGLSDGRVKVVSNVGIIGEGVDVPELSCCQLFCTVGSRVRFLQACGRIMRPAPGKKHGVLIDHSGAVFKHGFPDEDTEWTLEGNADAEFKDRHDKGDTAAALYCRHCEIVYHGDGGCPECGRLPSKPPKSIFAAPPVDVTGELLVEAERSGAAGAGREEKVKTWYACVATAKKRGGSMGQALVIYKKKYREWPGDDFPLMPGRGQWQAKVTDLFPEFGKKKEALPS